jgi:type I restriction-modification system DNA methylase subunit
MIEIPNTMFDSDEIADKISKFKLTPKQSAAAKEWKSRLDSGRIQVESQHEKEFADLILIQLLGYPDVGKGLEQKVKYMDYSIPPVFPNKGIVIELKSRGKDLFKEQLAYKDRPGKHTPIEQTIFYMRENPGYDYGICTNYEEFIFFKMGNFEKCYRFKFPKKGEKLSEDKIKEFVAIFSKKNIDNKKDGIENLILKTIEKQKTITDDFYQLFHETRQMLILAFETNSESQITKHEAITYAQMYLNRCLFIFFTEDNGLITQNVFSDEIENIIKKTDLKESTPYISTHIRTIFKWMDEGAVKEINHKLGFNGELFKTPLTRDAIFYDLKNPKFFEKIKQKSKYKEKPTLNENQKKIVERFNGNLNPIIVNLLIMAGHDFEKKINVNILGHVFEQSIDDIQKLQGYTKEEKDGSRKRFGVHYTPEYITKFICKNTIIPYLSKTDTIEPDELIFEYENDLQSLENKVKSIKIVDPACGSGAFLIQAINVLMDIYDRIQTLKQSKGEYQISGQLASEKLPKVRGRKKPTSPTTHVTLDRGLNEIKLRDIIKDNIYGVDINSESIEITKLSLFLKIASENKRLFSLSSKIQVGNSLINNEEIAGKLSFNWNVDFEEIFNLEMGGKGGFDIVIGNPPYLRLQGITKNDAKSKKYYKENYPITTTGRYDYYILFLDKGLKLLNKNGKLGFIIPHKFTSALFGVGIRKLLSENKFLKKFLHFSQYYVFKAKTYTGVMILDQQKNENFEFKEITNIENEELEPIVSSLTKKDFVKIPISSLSETPWSFRYGVIGKILNKVDQSGPEVLELFEQVSAGIDTGYDELYVLEKIEDKGGTLKLFSKKINGQVELEKEMLQPLLMGDDVKRHVLYEKTERFVVFPCTFEDGKPLTMEESELKKKFPLTYKYLSQFKKELIKLRTSAKDNPTFWYNLHRTRISEWFFDQERIITPYTSLGCEMTLDKFRNLHNTKVYSLVKKPTTSQNNLYFLAILNSKLFWYYIKFNWRNVLRDGWMTFTTNALTPFHFVIPDTSTEKKLIQYEEDLMKINSEIYEESSGFLRYIMRKFEIYELNKKLQKFYELDFLTFLKEIGKPTSNMTSDEEIDMDRLFVKTKELVLEKKKNIVFFEKQVDEIIYKLYNLTDTEIIDIEKNYPH